MGHGSGIFSRLMEDFGYGKQSEDLMGVYLRSISKCLMFEDLVKRTPKSWSISEDGYFFSLRRCCVCESLPDMSVDL